MDKKLGLRVGYKYPNIRTFSESFSDDGIVKILKYIRIIEPSSFYSETVGASSIIFINQNVDVEHFI